MKYDEGCAILSLGFSSLIAALLLPAFRFFFFAAYSLTY
jgi:hypothetical protein